MSIFLSNEEIAALVSERAATVAKDCGDREHVHTWKHAANEWADTAYNGLQHLRNIEDVMAVGRPVAMATVKAARENMERCCAYAKSVADTVYNLDTAPTTEANAEPAAIGAGDPMAFLAEFCDIHGYPSDGDMDAALRGAFYEGIRYCSVHSHTAHGQASVATQPAGWGHKRKDNTGWGSWLFTSEATAKSHHESNGARDQYEVAPLFAAPISEDTDSSGSLGADDPALEDVDLARRILVQLGYSISESRERGVDWTVDLVTDVITKDRAARTHAAPVVDTILQATASDNVWSDVTPEIYAEVQGAIGYKVRTLYTHPAPVVDLHAASELTDPQIRTMAWEAMGYQDDETAVWEFTDPSMIKFARAALAHHAAAELVASHAPSVPDWHAIDSAPKDGTTILLFAPAAMYEGKPIESRVTAGQWTEWEDTTSEFHATTGEYLGQSVQDGGALWSSWDGGFLEELPPTHWMPLPPAPKEPDNE